MCVSVEKERKTKGPGLTGGGWRDLVSVCVGACVFEGVCVCAPEPFVPF